MFIPFFRALLIPVFVETPKKKSLGKGFNSKSRLSCMLSYLFTSLLFCPHLSHHHLNQQICKASAMFVLTSGIQFDCQPSHLGKRIKFSVLHQTVVKAKLNLPANASHINATVKEAGCNFVCISMKLLHR